MAHEEGADPSDAVISHPVRVFDPGDGDNSVNDSQTTSSALCICLCDYLCASLADDFRLSAIRM